MTTTKTNVKEVSTLTQLQVDVLAAVKAHTNMTLTRFRNMAQTPEELEEIEQLLLSEDAPLLVFAATEQVVLASDFPNYYASPFSACFEIPTLEETEIPAGKTVLVPLQVTLEGLGIKDVSMYSLRLFPRSSMHKAKEDRELILTNSVGIVDSDYPDMIFAKITNIGKKPYVVAKGERLVQGEAVQVNRLPNVPTKYRKRTGGHGSTGKF